MYPYKSVDGDHDYSKSSPHDRGSVAKQNRSFTDDFSIDSHEINMNTVERDENNHSQEVLKLSQSGKDENNSQSDLEADMGAQHHHHHHNHEKEQKSRMMVSH